MKENTNKAIVLNSMVLYLRLIVVTVCELITTRYALMVLGINDFGLFSVLGSIISFMALFNTIMMSTTNRFISVAIGKGDRHEINIQFNICLFIHIAIALVALLLFIPIGDVYISHYLQYEGNISTAIDVFHITVIGSIISFIGVPYEGLLTAKENFFIPSFTNICAHIIKLAVTISLLYYFENKLLVYAFTQGFTTGGKTIVYYIYTKVRHSDITKFFIPKSKEQYKNVFSFSGWIAYGAVAMIGKNQGAAILVNAFFNTAMNTALGLANSVSTLINSFANSIATPIAPQITKSYVSGNTHRTDELMIMSTKYTYLFTLIISIPFLASPFWLFTIWLGDVPNYVIDFTYLIIIDTLVISLNSGISNLIFASGRIKLYQVVVNTLRFFSIIAAYFVLKCGFEAHSLLWCYILFSVAIFFVSQKILYVSTGFDNKKLWKHSYWPSLIITLIIVPFFLLEINIHPILHIALIEVIAFAAIFFIGCSSKEKAFIQYRVKKALFKKNNYEI